jgi:hypothetical protein
MDNLITYHDDRPSFEPLITLDDTNRYGNVYYRLTAGYVWGKGLDKEPFDSFCSEIQQIFIDLGFEYNRPESSGACPTVTRGAESLYCHPMHLNGYIKEENVLIIAEHLKTAKTFRLRHIDQFGVIYNYTPNEIDIDLDRKKQDIIAAFLKGYEAPSKKQAHTLLRIMDIELPISLKTRGAKSSNPTKGIEKILWDIKKDILHELVCKKKIEAFEIPNNKNIQYITRKMKKPAKAAA